MAKNTAAEQARTEEFFDHINGATSDRVARFREQMKTAVEEAAADAKRKRIANLAFEMGHCLFGVAGIAAIKLAEIYNLISPVLTTPIYAFGFAFIGWHFCKFNGYWRRNRNA